MSSCCGNCPRRRRRQDAVTDLIGTGADPGRSTSLSTLDDKSWPDSLSERTPIATTTSTRARGVTAVGRPVPLFDVQLVDDDDEAVPTGTVGGLRAPRSRLMFEG